MRSLTRRAAAVAIAGVAKTAAGSGVSLLHADAAFAAQCTNAGSDATRVKSAVMTGPWGNQGHVYLWYSSSTRCVAAQFDTDGLACQTSGLYCGAAYVDDHGTDTAICTTDNGVHVGDHGCKTGFVNDANITQRARAYLNMPAGSLSYGVTAYY